MLIDYPIFAAPLSHIFLTVYNLLVYIGGIVFLIVGCFMNSQRYLLYDLFVDSFALSLMLLVMVGITAGVLLIDVSFYRGSLVEGSCQIIALSVLMLLICTFELSAFLSGTLLRGQIENRTRSELKTQLALYEIKIDTNLSSKTENWMDNLQPQIECCGVDSPNDWASKFGMPNRVPDSCCVKSMRSVKGCGRLNNVTINATVSSNQTSVIYTRGCMDVFLLWMRHDVIKFSVVCFVLCIMQILGIIGLCLANDHVESRWVKSRNSSNTKSSTATTSTSTSTSK